MNAHFYIGIDPSGSDHRPSGLCVLTRKREIVRLQRWFSFNELPVLLDEYAPDQCLVGVDGPLQPPHELHRCCFEDNSRCPHRQTTPYKGRSGEYQLIRMGFPCFPTSKNSFLRGWVRRCFALNDWLVAQGFPILEVFPFATRRILFPTLSGKKQQRAFREHLQCHLQEWGIRFPESEHLYSHDELDAVLAAVTVWLHDRGKTQLLGDERDGWIVIPQINGLG